MGGQIWTLKAHSLTSPFICLTGIWQLPSGSIVVRDLEVSLMTNFESLAQWPLALALRIQWRSQSLEVGWAQRVGDGSPTAGSICHSLLLLPYSSFEFMQISRPTLTEVGLARAHPLLRQCEDQVLGLGLSGQVLALEGKSLACAVRLLALWFVRLLLCRHNDINHWKVWPLLSTWSASINRLGGLFSSILCKPATLTPLEGVFSQIGLYWDHTECKCLTVCLKP